MKPDALSFTLGQVFPADDVVAQWAATIALAFNDISMVSVEMEADADDPARQHRFLYWLRIMISHFGEAVSWLRTTLDIPEIQAVIESLPREAQESLEKCIETYIEHETAIERIRNTTAFHYPDLKAGSKRSLIRRALEALAGEQVVIRRGRVKDARMLFADDLLGKMFVDASGEDDFDRVHRDISQGLSAFMRFANPVLTTHFEKKGGEGVTFERVELSDDGTWRVLPSDAGPALAVPLAAPPGKTREPHA